MKRLNLVSKGAAVMLLFSLSYHSDARAEFTVEETASGVTVKHDGELVTRYIVKDEAGKPYFWPLIGPTGKRMTRAYPMEDQEGEKQDHPHHRSLWFGHQVIDGFDTWHEPRTMDERKLKPGEKDQRLALLGSTAHREFLEVAADDDHAVIASANEYCDNAGKAMMEDERRVTFRMDGDALVVDFDIVLVALKDLVLGEAKDAGLSVRVAHSMCVDAGEGGKIVNSHGDEDKAAWGQRAEWCSFHGPVEGEVLGVTIMNHPKSYRHPTAWHARTYGLFTANAFMDPDEKVSPEKEIALKKGDRITLYHRIMFHGGDAEAAGVAKAWKAYAEESK